jgi:hypothetical protein
MGGKSKLKDNNFHSHILFKEMNERNSSNKEGIMQSNVKQIKNNV